nr:Uncharacterised protein [Klebsiella pneumoniae]
MMNHPEAVWRHFVNLLFESIYITRQFIVNTGEPFLNFSACRPVTFYQPENIINCIGNGVKLAQEGSVFS